MFKVDPGMTVLQNPPSHGYERVLNTLAHWDSQGLRGTSVFAWVTGVPVEPHRFAKAFFLLLFSITLFWGLCARPFLCGKTHLFDYV